MEQFFTALYAAGHKSFDSSIERLIAFLRIALASFCLILLTTSPSVKSQYVLPFELILAIYILFGMCVAIFVVVAKFRTGWQLPVHLIDLCITSILIYFVPPLSTTFLVLCLFVFLNATFRWNWRGALWTTVGLIAAQAILVVTGKAILPSIDQWFFLVMIGGTFVFFGASRERNAEHLAQISAWPSSKIQSYADIDDHWLDSSLRHIAKVMQVPRVLTQWEIMGEPYSFYAYYTDGMCYQKRAVENQFNDVLPQELANLTFAYSSTESNECLTSFGIKHCVEPVIAKAFQAQYEITSMCSAPISGEICKGRIFMFDRSDWGDDDITMATIIASRLRFELEYYAISLQLQETAVSRERTRLAHDLHDGVLQSLTAAGLQLTVLASTSKQDLRHKLDNVRKLLQNEQRRVRGFINEQRLQPARRNLTLHSEIERQVKKIKQQWASNIQLSIDTQGNSVSSALAQQIELVLTEAVANAVQHGKASCIAVLVKSLPDNVLLLVTDNGCGLTNASGSYNLNELIAHHLGPQSICKRVSNLGGELSLVTSTSGVELRIELPYNRKVINKDEKIHAIS